MQGSKDEFANDFRNWNPKIHECIRVVDTPFKWALFARPPMETWVNGRVALLGDACHSMLPMLAQGAVMSLEDGYIIGRALEAAGGDVVQGWQRYERARIERTTKVVAGSAENGKRFQSRTLGNAEEAEAYVNREWTPEKVRARYGWLFSYDVTTVVV